MLVFDSGTGKENSPYHPLRADALYTREFGARQPMSAPSFCNLLTTGFVKQLALPPETHKSKDMGRYLTGFAVCLALLLSDAAWSQNLNGAQEMDARRAMELANQQKWPHAFAVAEESGIPVLKKIMQWMYYSRRGSDASFEEIIRFIQKNPNWPQQDRMLENAERALYAKGDASPELVNTWFEIHAPITGRGKIRYAEALLVKAGSDKTVEDKAHQLIREGWTTTEMDGAEHESFMTKYGRLLRQDDYIAKIDYLLWQKDVPEAEALLRKVPADYQALYRARIAVINNKPNASLVIGTVPARLQKDPGLLFNRIVWRDERSRDNEVRELLLDMPPTARFPERVWDYRAKHIQKALEAKRYKEAYTLARNHGLRDGATDGEDFARATWLSGWISLRFLSQPRTAYTHFYEMYHGVSTPVSLARAAYWAGLCAKENGNPDIAKTWFETAARHPTTFYGQLAHKEIGKTLVIPDTPQPTAEEFAAFRKTELARGIQLLMDIEYDDQARLLMEGVLANSKNPKEHEMTAMLAEEMGNRKMAVKAAKLAQRYGIVLLHSGYPVVSVSPKPGVDKAFALAITRQESEFDAHAISSAGAVGLMQLLPSTAKQVARQAGISFSPADLHNPSKNMELGTYFLADLMDNYGGAMPLAIAAYNAGPGRVRQWLDTNGDYRKGQIGMLEWLELIPYKETRNYVQRVLENYEVYKYKLKKAPSKKQADE